MAGAWNGADAGLERLVIAECIEASRIDVRGEQLLVAIEHVFQAI